MNRSACGRRAIGWPVPVVMSGGKGLRVFLRNERRGERLVVAQRQQSPAQGGAMRGLRQLDHTTGKRWQRAGNLEIAVDARDLFDEVNLALHVQAPGWHGDGELRARAFDIEAKAAQDARNLRRRNLHAEDAPYLAGGERDARLREGARHHVQLFAHLAASGFHNQLGYARAGQLRDARVGAALVTMAGVGVHAQAARSAAHAGRIEPGRLNQHVLRAVGNHRRLAAHDSGDGHGLDGVGDDEVFGRQLALHAIERDDGLARLGAAHNDLAALEFVQVKGVRRLADFVQRVVAGIGHVADAALLDQLQAMRNLLRRWSHLHSAHHTSRVTRAPFGVGNLNDEVRRAAGRQLGRNRAQVKIVDGRDLAGHAVMVHGVHAIGGDLGFPGLVVTRSKVAFNGDAADGEGLGHLAVGDRRRDKIANPIR